MSNTKHAILLVFSLLIGFVIGLGIKYVYETQTTKPYMWDNPPVLINCYGEDFSELQLNRAIDYWELHGEKIAFYEMNPPEEVCANEWLDGFIILRKASPSLLEEPTLASTQRWTSGIEFKSAIIYFQPGAQNLTLLIEHELGHALGYAHVDIEGHIMHPVYEKMGTNFWIP